MAETKIEWADRVWNPVTGCNKVSPGCKRCYAEPLSLRLKRMGQHKYRNEFEVTEHPDTLEIPRRWKKPSSIFVNSMSDLFHEQVSDDFIRRVFDVMVEVDQHRYMVLTKRPERTVELNPVLPWRPQIWMGVSVENPDYQFRIDLLRETDAHVKFLSLEPLLQPLPDLNLDGIDWVIVGGESGPGATPMGQDWVIDIRDQCSDAGVAFYFKQWGGPVKSRNGRLLEERTWDEVPDVKELLTSR